MGTADAGNLFLGQKFNSYEEFHAYFKRYCEHTKQIYCVSNSKSVEQYNRLHTKKVDPRLKYACIQYTCRYGGKERHRGTGIRPVQRFVDECLTVDKHLLIRSKDYSFRGRNRYSRINTQVLLWPTGFILFLYCSLGIIVAC